MRTSEKNPLWHFIKCTDNSEITMVFPDKNIRNAEDKLVVKHKGMSIAFVEEWLSITGTIDKSCDIKHDDNESIGMVWVTCPGVDFYMNFFIPIEEFYELSEHPSFSKYIEEQPLTEISATV